MVNSWLRTTATKTFRPRGTCASCWKNGVAVRRMETLGLPRLQLSMGMATYTIMTPPDDPSNPETACNSVVNTSGGIIEKRYTPWAAWGMESTPPGGLGAPPQRGQGRSPHHGGGCSAEKHSDDSKHTESNREQSAARTSMPVSRPCQTLKANTATGHRSSLRPRHNKITPSLDWKLSTFYATMWKVEQ